MPGLLTSHINIAAFAPDWSVYRDNISADDDLLNPGLMSEVISLQHLPSGAGCQLWLVPERIAGTGTCLLTDFYNTTGSLAAVLPLVPGDTVGPIVTLSEVRLTNLLAVIHRVLVTGLDPGAVWRLHYTCTSLPIG